MEKSEVRIRRRILRGLSTHRRQRASRRGFSLGERGLRKSSLPSPSLVSWNHSVFLVHFVSLSLSLFSPSLSFLFSRTCVAVGHGAAHRRRYAPGCRGWLDSSRVVRSSIRRPSSPLLCSFSCLFPSPSNTFAVASLVRERHCYYRSCSLPLSDFPPSISYFLIWLI